MPERVVKSTCHRCHCECGVLVHVRDGKVVKIEGDHSHPFNEGILCPKCFATIEALYHPDRLKYPLIKEGKGWRRVSWDEALTLIARRLTEIKEKYGSVSICTSSGDNKGFVYISMLLAYALGTPNVMRPHPHICFFPTWIASDATFGHFITTEPALDLDHAKCIMLWGTNPTTSHQPLVAKILRTKKNGGKLIVIDPRFIPLAQQADIWLQIRPATDGCLAMGLLNVIIKEELFDREFVSRWCVGFEELKARALAYDLKKVSEITWVPEKQIIEAARIYATTRPALLYPREGLNMNTNSVQSQRAVHCLIALTGNVDVQGGNMIRNLPPAYKSDMALRQLSGFRPPREVEEKRIGAREFPLLSGPDAVAAFAHSPTGIKAMLTGKPYPLKAMVVLGSNLVTSLENSKEAYEALSRLEFLVVADVFMTPTAELADVVLPAALWPEKNDISDLLFPNYLAIREKAVDPVGECWDDKKIVFELAKKMGLNYFKNLGFESVEEFLAYRLKTLGETWESFKEKGIITYPIRYKKYEEKGFPTQTGKVELYSKKLEKFGYDPLPHYVEPPESPLSTPHMAQEYPLIMINGRNIFYFGSGERQISSLRREIPDPLLEIHPQTARKLGINDSAWVRVETPRGEVKYRAKLTEGIHPQVVCGQWGWWFPEKMEKEHGCFESNINVLISNDPPYDPIAGSTLMRGFLCKVTKI